MAEPRAAVKASQKPVLYAVLLTAGAIVAIGVGGGLIRPMQDRWERLLTAAERETTRHQAAAQQRARADALRAAAPAPSRRASPTLARRLTPDDGGPEATDPEERVGIIRF